MAEMIAVMIVDSTMDKLMVDVTVDSEAAVIVDSMADLLAAMMAL